MVDQFIPQIGDYPPELRSKRVRGGDGDIHMLSPSPTGKSVLYAIRQSFREIEHGVLTVPLMGVERMRPRDVMVEVPTFPTS